MGGFEDYSTINTIQQYNVSSNGWRKLQVNLPIKLAKMGAGKLSDKELFIVGGIYEDTRSAKGSFSLISNSYKLKMDTKKWSKGSKMTSKRTLHSSLVQTPG